MNFVPRTVFLTGVLAGLVVGCETVENARLAQARVGAHTNDVVAVSATNAPARVNLVGNDLYGYVAFAMTNRPSLEVSRLAVSNAALALAEVTSDRALQLSLSGGYSQGTANGSHFSWHQDRGSASADFSADLLICDFGRIEARELEARENLVAARRSLADAEFAVFSEVAQAYFTLLRNDALLDVVRTNEFVRVEHLRQSESLFSAGEAKKLDVLKARVDLSDARLARINASNDVVTAGAEFIRTLGLAGDRTSREEVMEPRADALGRVCAVLPATSYVAEDGLQLARTNAPGLMVARAKLRAAGARVDYAVADLLPELSLSSAFSFADPAWNWSWGFRVVQSVLDGFRKRTRVDAAVVDLESARAEVEAVEQTLSCELAVAAATRDNARQSFETSVVAEEQARENFANVMMQYRVGDASRLDFTDAANTLATALGARVKAFYAGELAEAELIRLTGRVPGYGKTVFAPARPAPRGTHREVNDHEMD